MIYSASTYSNAISRLREIKDRVSVDIDFLSLSLLVDAVKEKFDRDYPDRKPLTKPDLEGMDFQRVWLAYPSDDTEEIADVEDYGEWALVYHGLIYSLSSLEGAGFEDLLLDCMKGEDINQSSGKYQVYREPHFYIGE